MLWKISNTYKRGDSKIMKFCISNLLTYAQFCLISISQTLLHCPPGYFKAKPDFQTFHNKSPLKGGDFHRDWEN
jgi:hypothetical protein